MELVDYDAVYSGMIREMTQNLSDQPEALHKRLVVSMASILKERGLVKTSEAFKNASELSCKDCLKE